MDYATHLWIFTALLFGIIIVPGMDMIFVLANALTGGLRAGFAATAGVMLGGAVHTITGVFGVGLLMALMPSLVRPMLLVGAAYMIWVGYGLIRSSIIVSKVEPVGHSHLVVKFRQGFFTCLFNPKAWLFVLAVYPQFVKPAYGPTWQQAVVLGLLTMLMQLAIYGLVVLVAGQARDFLLTNKRATVLVGRFAGALIIAAALLTVWQGFQS